MTKYSKQPDHLGLISGVTTAIAWGMAGIFVRLLPPVSPLWIAAGRLAFAWVAMLPVALFLLRSNRSFGADLFRGEAWVLAVLLGAYYALATYAFRLAPVAEVALFLGTSPLFVLGFRKLRGFESAGVERAGALLAFIGIGVIMAPGLSFAEAARAHLLGDALALGAACVTALYALYFRQLSERQRAPDAASVASITFALGAAALFLICELFGIPGATGLARGDWLLFACFGAFSTALPSYSFAIAAKRLPPLLTTTISLFIPLFAAVFARLLLDEALSPTLIPGGLLLFSGLMLMLLRKNA